MGSQKPQTAHEHFFPPPGVESLLLDIAGQHIDLERPPKGGEHAHTVDDELKVMSLKFRRTCEESGKDDHE